MPTYCKVVLAASDTGNFKGEDTLLEMLRKTQTSDTRN